MQAIAGPGVTWPLTSSGDMPFQPNGFSNSVLTLHQALGSDSGLPSSTLTIETGEFGYVHGITLTATDTATPALGALTLRSGSGVIAVGDDRGYIVDAAAVKVQNMSTLGDPVAFLGSGLAGLGVGMTDPQTGYGNTGAAILVVNAAVSGVPFNFITVTGSGTAGGDPTFSGPTIAASPGDNVTDFAFDLNLQGASGGAVATLSGWKTKVITKNSLPTVALSSGIGAQVSTVRDIDLAYPVTFTPTAGAAATCLVELSPDNTTYSTLVTVTVPAGTALDSFVQPVSVHLPANWWVRLTTTNATLAASGTYY